jgi:hypothetical protein
MTNPQPSPLTERLRVRIHSLVNRGAEICPEFEPGEHRVSCVRCGYMPDVHLLRDAFAALSQQPSSPLTELIATWREAQGHYASLPRPFPDDGPYYNDGREITYKVCADHLEAALAQSSPLQEHEKEKE